MLAPVGAVEKLSVEQLNADYGKNELEQYVHNEDVDDIFQRVDDTIEDRL